MKSIIYIIALTILSLLAACGNRQSQNPQLSRIYELSESDPAAALAALDSVNPERLSDPDRHYYDFLTIKVNDKNYIKHTSDSLYLAVHAHYKGDKSMFPEVLYYGGRVCSDLGDYPTALKYFQEAIDAIPPGQQGLKLHGAIAIQMGQLLNQLRLYEEALPFLHKAVEIDSLIETSYILAYDLNLLGKNLLELKQYDLAKMRFRQAQALIEDTAPEEKANIDVGIAATELYQGNIDSALCAIRQAINTTSRLYHNVALMYATQVYQAAGIRDTAFRCAYDLAHSGDIDNRRWGYGYLLSPTLLPLSPSDSIPEYALNYLALAEQYLSKHDAQQALMQQSLYNYQLHERDRLNAEQGKQRLVKWTYLGFILALCLIITTLYFRNKNNRTLLRLHKTLNDLTLLKERIITQSAIPSDWVDAGAYNPIDTETHKIRNQIQKNLLDLLEQGSNRPTDVRILNSTTYDTLQQFIKDEKCIGDSNSLWSELEKIVMETSSHLKQNLRLLLGRDAKPIEMQTILLIKCGVSPTQMATLLGLTKGSVTSRRKSLGNKMFGTEVGIQNIDDLIRLL